MRDHKGITLNTTNPARTAPKAVTSGFYPLTQTQLTGTLAGLMLTLMLAALDQTIVGTAMPRIISQLNGFNRYPWVTTAYLLTSTIAVPVFAKLSDLYGRKGFFLFGTGLFIFASALCGAAGEFSWMPIDGMNQLILFRGIQGVAAGIIVGLLFAIIGDIFSPVERGKYQGLFAGVWGVASIFGPTLGGWLTDTWSWRWTFYVNLPVGLVALAAIWYALPVFHPSGARRIIDWAGVGTLIGCLAPLLLALTWASDYGWTSERVVVLLIVAVVFGAAFIFAEGRAAEPPLPLSLFRNPVIASSCIAIFIMGLGMFGVIVYLPLFMQGVQGTSATASGSLLTPLMMAAVVGSIFTGQFTSRTARYKNLALVASVLVAFGMFLLARLTPESSRFEVVRDMILVGIGFGVLPPVYTLAVQNAAPRHQMGAATASVQFFRSIGSTFGVSIFGTVMLSLYKDGFDKAVPPGTPAIALKPFANPLQLMQIRARLEAAFGQYPGGPALLHKLLDNVRTSLAHSLQVIFLVGAGIMVLAVLANLWMPEVELRKSSEPVAPPVEA